MIYFENWWSLGENCLINKYKGYFADDKIIKDICISSQDQMSIFTKSISECIVKKNPITKKFELVPNKDDYFLSNKMTIDFNKYVLFVFVGAEVKEVLFSQIFKCYLIKFSDTKCEKNEYCAAIVYKYYLENRNEVDYKFQYLNNKPPNIIKQRPTFDNDEY